MAVVAVVVAAAVAAVDWRLPLAAVRQPLELKPLELAVVVAVAAVVVAVVAAVAHVAVAVFPPVVPWLLAVPVVAAFVPRVLAVHET